MPVRTGHSPASSVFRHLCSGPGLHRSRCTWAWYTSLARTGKASRWNRGRNGHSTSLPARLARCHPNSRPPTCESFASRPPRCTWADPVNRCQEASARPRPGAGDVDRLTRNPPDWSRGTGRPGLYPRVTRPRPSPHPAGTEPGSPSGALRHVHDTNNPLSTCSASRRPSMVKSTATALVCARIPVGAAQDPAVAEDPGAYDCPDPPRKPDPPRNWGERDGNGQEGRAGVTPRPRVPF